jgi:hypothetical protein
LARSSAGKRIEVGGGLFNLTTDEWLAWWQPFRQRHPQLAAGLH